MDLTILGCSAGMPSAGRSSAGYLVQHDGTAVLLDAGPGVAAALTRHLDARALDAVFISHLHTDHLYDILPIGKMLMATRTACSATGEPYLLEAPRVPLFVPSGATERLRTLAALFPVTTYPWFDRPFELAFETIEYTPALTTTVGTMTLRLAELDHVAPNCAVRLEAERSSVVYSGDTGVTARLPALAGGAGALLVENTLDTADRSQHGHLSTADAARAAAEAGVGRLLLTHYPVLDPDRRARRLAEAAAIYAGPIDLVEPDDVYAVPERSVDETTQPLAASARAHVGVTEL